MSARNAIRVYLDGEGPLWKIFWLWGVVGSWILFGIFLLAIQAFGVTWAIFAVAGIVMLPYTVWILVSVWMCSRNVRNPGWGDVARLLTFLWAANIGVAAGLLLAELVLGRGIMTTL